jgi:hypothetical protein
MTLTSRVFISNLIQEDGQIVQGNRVTTLSHLMKYTIKKSAHETKVDPMVLTDPTREGYEGRAWDVLPHLMLHEQDLEPECFQREAGQ